MFARSHITLLLAAWLTAGACLGGTNPAQPPVTVNERFHAYFSEGLAGRSGMAIAIHAGEQLGGTLSQALLPVLGRFLPPGLTGLAGPLLGQFVTTVAAKAGFDLATNLYKTKLKDQPAVPMDFGDTLAGSMGATIGNAIFSAAFGPLAGRLLGSWLGWSLASNVLKQLRKGPEGKLKAAFSDLNVPRIFLERVAIEGASYAARVVMGTTLIAPLASSPFGLPLSLGLEALFASTASAAALAVYDTALERRRPANTDLPPVPVGAKKLVSLHSALVEAYRSYLDSLKLNGSLDSRTRRAYSDYIAARDTYDRALSASSTGTR